MAMISGFPNQRITILLSFSINNRLIPLGLSFQNTLKQFALDMTCAGLKCETGIQMKSQYC